MSEKIKVHFLSCEGQSKYTKTVVITILRNVKLFLSFKDTIQQKRFKSNKKNQIWTFIFKNYFKMYFFKNEVTAHIKSCIIFIKNNIMS